MTRNGFTLVEVLVALVAGSFLLGSISWVLAGLSDDLREMEQHTDVQQQLHASGLLENILSDARFSNADGKAKPRSADQLAFRMTAPLSLPHSGQMEAILAVREDRGGKSLKLRWPENDLPEITLLTGMDDLEIQYEANADNDVFLNRITIVYLEAGARSHGKMHFYPRINAVGACIYDPISQRCRT